MANIKINETKKVIEITKSFEKKARMYGTKEYDDLQIVRRDYPNFKVITKAARRNTDGFKGLTFEYMEKYIKEHSEEKDLLAEFYKKCGRNENGENIDFFKGEPYGKIKKWFLEQYPIFQEYRKNNLKKTA